MVGMAVLKGKLSNSWISYSNNYFSCGPDQILTRRHVKALLQLTAWGSTVHRAQRHGRRCEAAITSHPQPESRGRCIVVLGTPCSFGLVPSPQDSDGHTQGRLPALVQISRNIRTNSPEVRLHYDSRSRQTDNED